MVGGLFKAMGITRSPVFMIETQKQFEDPVTPSSLSPLVWLTPITVHASTVVGFRTWFPAGSIVRN